VGKEDGLYPALVGRICSAQNNPSAIAEDFKPSVLNQLQQPYR
jgi:hypothetical protein